jgi:UDP-glucose 4-epimerase
MVAGCDVLVHLASITDYHPTYGEYVRNNVAELASLFEHTLDVGAFVLISSQTVYGTAPLPYDPSDGITRPTEHYGLSKLMQEQVSSLLCRVSLYILRPSIILGPGQNPRSLYAGLIKNTVARLNAGMSPMIYGDGTQLRSYVDVRDVARYVELVAESRTPRISNATSNEGPLSVNYIVGKIGGLMGVDIEPCVGEWERVVDLQQKDQVSACAWPEFWGPAATGKALKEYVESLLVSGNLPSREYIEQTDRENVEWGVVRKVEK